MKLCIDCDLELPSYQASRCNEHSRVRAAKRQREWADQNRERLAAKAHDRYVSNFKGRVIQDYSRRRLYGISSEQFDLLSTAQGGKCKICGRLPTGRRSGAVLHVDHDHATGKIRGLLCRECNRGLGMLGDNPEALSAVLGQYAVGYPAGASEGLV